MLLLLTLSWSGVACQSATAPASDPDTLRPAPDVLPPDSAGRRTPEDKPEVVDPKLGVTEGNWVWYDGQRLKVEGRGWTNTAGPYHRLPAGATVPGSGISHHTAGVAIYFITDASEVQVRWTVSDGGDLLGYNHMPTTGVSGVDLYERNEAGTWGFVGNAGVGGWTQQSNCKTFTVKAGRENVLYLPLYNGVKAIEIGVPKDKTVLLPRQTHVTSSKPIVFYGTSITQGACADRPGMSATAIVGRELDVPVINLGFSGCGNMDPGMADLLAELDPSVYVIDCLWNMDPGLVAARTEPLVRKLREQHPNTPILLVEDSNFNDLPTEKGRILRDICEQLRKQGDGNLHFLSNKGMLGKDGEGTVEGTHLNSLGMMRQATVFVKTLRPLWAQATAHAGTGQLETDFAAPPMAARPHVWWHWMGADFSKTGITKDLEAMKASGIGGATIFNLGAEIGNNPWPEQTYRGAAYWDALRHTLAEAQRLGMEISLLGTPGYSTTGGPWIDLERGMKRVVWSITEADGGKELALALPAIGGGALGRGIAVLAVPVKEHVSVKEVVDVTGMMDAAGNLTWNAPAGKWKIYRFGYAPTGKAPHPIPEDLVGHTYEADKMSAEISRYNWEQVLKPLKENLGEYCGKTLKSISIDSYESGEQNWTPAFREEFMRRKGYDPVPWLVTLGHPLVQSWFFDSNRRVIPPERPNPSLTVLGSAEETRRFEWDYRDVISGLFFDNGWKVARKMCNDAGLEFWHECYRGPFDRNQGATSPNIPMVEFWTEKGNENAPSIFPADIGAAQAADRRIVASEAFSGGPTKSRWTEDPAFLKIFGDEAFAQGVNRFMVHHWTHQPFDDKYQPGRTMFAWGTHFGRHQTWYEPGKAFFAYLARCQTLLQQGERVIDALCLDQQEGESDVIAKDVFLQSEVKVIDGNIVLPSGRKYAYMVFPRDAEMLPEVAQKLKLLVADGATVVSTRPKRSPSLKDYPQCEETLRQLGDEVWGSGSENRYQKGYVFSRVEDAKAKLGLKPDYTIEKASADASKVMVLHRRKSEVDIYYISNQSEKAQALSLSFRVSGRQPELWQAEDGTLTDAPVWSEKAGRTGVDLQLKGIQTVFVVFRKAAAKTEHIVSLDVKGGDAVVVMKRSGKPVLRSSMASTAEISYSTGRKCTVEFKPDAAVALAGEWAVSFAPKLGAPFNKAFPELMDFSKHDSKDVKYFSGSATYRKKITVSGDSLKAGRLVLDLGVMNDLAQVRVNGKDVGVLWYPPYTADITDYLNPGDNELEIVVTNNWANQLVGDEQEPRDFEVGDNVDWGVGCFGCQLKRYPDWFIKGQPRPSQGRKTFTTWQYFTKDSPLQPAGLVGPVRLVRQSECEL